MKIVVCSLFFYEFKCILNYNILFLFCKKQKSLGFSEKSFQVQNIFWKKRRVKEKIFFSKKFSQILKPLKKMKKSFSSHS